MRGEAYATDVLSNIDTSRTPFFADPFLKWAGGKRWLSYRYKSLFPTDFKNYHEPFLGSAAIFFSVRPQNAILGDSNQELIKLYITIRDAPKDIDALMHEHQRKHSKEYYYHIRANKSKDPIVAASQFLYLNRSCWNGLYRVNKQGQFNVPIGTKTNIILPNDDFVAVSAALKRASLKAQDFSLSIDEVRQGDFLFVDPPYTVRHDNNGFVKYNEDIFRWSDQVRLRQKLDEASNRGAKIMVTNANHASIKELYANFGYIHEVNRSSVISGLSTGRVKATELIIRNY